MARFFYIKFNKIVTNLATNKPKELRNWIKLSLIDVRNFEKIIIILKYNYNVERKVVLESIYYKHPDSINFIKGENIGAKYTL